MRRAIFLSWLLFLTISTNAQYTYDSDGYLVAYPEDMGPNGYLAHLGFYANNVRMRGSQIDERDMAYKSYFFPNWHIPSKLTGGNWIYSYKMSVDQRPSYLAYWWNDMHCNFYLYYFLKYLGLQKRVVSYLTTPLFHYKVYNDGSVKIMDAAGRKQIAQKSAEFEIGRPEIDTYGGGGMNDLGYKGTAIDPCDIARESHYEVYYSPNLGRIPMGVLSAATVNNGSHIVLLETESAGPASGYKTIDNGTVNGYSYSYSNYSWQLMDSRGKVLFKRNYYGKENLTAILTVPGTSSANGQSSGEATSADNYKKGNAAFPDAFYLLAGTEIEDTTIKNKKPFKTDFCANLYDKTGELIWKRKYGGNDFDRCAAALATRDGKYFILAGSTRSGSGRDVTKGPISAADAVKDIDYWCIKIDLRGKLIWDARFGTTDRDILNSIAEADNGDILLGGFTSGVVTTPAGTRGGSQAMSMPGNNYYVVKIDSFGILKWSKIFGGQGNDRLYQMIPSKSNKRFHLWGMSDSKELFPQGVSSKTVFHSEFDTTFERTTTYLLHITIDENGKQLSSSFEIPTSGTNGVMMPHEENVFSYGYVYRISDDYQFNKEYLYANEVLDLVNAGDPNTYSRTVIDTSIIIPRVGRQTVEEHYIKDIVSFAVHSEETNRLLPHSERGAVATKKATNPGKMPKKETTPNKKEQPENVFAPKETKDKNEQVEKPDIKPKEQKTPDGIVIPEKQKGKTTAGIKSKQTKNAESKSKVEKPSIKPKEQKAPDSLGIPEGKKVIKNKTVEIINEKNREILFDNPSVEKKRTNKKGENKLNTVSNKKNSDTSLKKEVKTVEKKE